MGVNKWWRNRKGSSTMEYIVIIAVGAIFALLLFNVVTDSGIQGMLKEKVIAIIQDIDTPSDNEQISTSVNDPDNSLKWPVGYDPSGMAPSTDGLIGDSNESSEKEVHNKDVTNVGGDNNTGPASTTDSEKNESLLTEVGKGVLDFIGYYDAKAAITGVDENGHKISVGERILRGAMLLPVAKPVKGVKLVAKYGDDVLVATKGKLDDITRKLKKRACACPQIRVNVAKTAGSGKGLIRYLEAGEYRFQMKSGHGYLREHRTGYVNDIGTMDEIEETIVRDVISKANKGYNFPLGKPEKNIHHCTVNGRKVGYDVIRLGDKYFSVSTYYPLK